MVETQPLAHDILEPAASPHIDVRSQHEVNTSIAISLKRIADALTNPNQYENPITQAILNGISQGAQDWIGQMARNGR